MEGRDVLRDGRVADTVPGVPSPSLVGPDTVTIREGSNTETPVRRGSPCLEGGQGGPYHNRSRMGGTGP